MSEILRVGGLDPSLTSFGIAVTYGPDTVPFVYRVQPRTRGHVRLAVLLDRVAGLVASCDVVAIEGVAYGARGSALLDLAGLSWLVRHELWKMGIPYAVIPPATRAKWITGSGTAGKDECLLATAKRFPAAEITGNDQADALVLAAMASEAYGCPLTVMPKTATALLHVTRTDKRHKGEPVIGWPELNGARLAPVGGNVGPSR